LWRKVTWGLAFTPLVFTVLISLDLTTALAVALVFAPELVVTTAVVVLLMLLGRRVLRAMRPRARRGVSH
jgi:uncharacterized membrane protein